MPHNGLYSFYAGSFRTPGIEKLNTEKKDRLTLCETAPIIC